MSWYDNAVKSLCKIFLNLHYISAKILGLLLMKLKKKLDKINCEDTNTF